MILVYVYCDMSILKATTCLDIPGNARMGWYCYTATLISFFLIKCWYYCYRVLWWIIEEYEGNFIKLSHHADVEITQSNYPLV